MVSNVPSRPENKEIFEERAENKTPYEGASKTTQTNGRELSGRENKRAESLVLLDLEEDYIQDIYQQIWDYKEQIGLWEKGDESSMPPLELDLTRYEEVSLEKIKKIVDQIKNYDFSQKAEDVRGALTNSSVLETIDHLVRERERLEQEKNEFYARIEQELQDLAWEYQIQFIVKEKEKGKYYIKPKGFMDEIFLAGENVFDFYTGKSESAEERKKRKEEEKRQKEIRATSIGFGKSVDVFPGNHTAMIPFSFGGDGMDIRVAYDPDKKKRTDISPGEVENLFQTESDLQKENASYIKISGLETLDDFKHPILDKSDKWLGLENTSDQIKETLENVFSEIRDVVRAPSSVSSSMESNTETQEGPRVVVDLIAPLPSYVDSSQLVGQTISFPSGSGLGTFRIQEWDSNNGIKTLVNESSGFILHIYPDRIWVEAPKEDLVALEEGKLSMYINPNFVDSEGFIQDLIEDSEGPEITLQEARDFFRKYAGRRFYLDHSKFDVFDTETLGLSKLQIEEDNGRVLREDQEADQKAKWLIYLYTLFLDKGISIPVKTEIQEETGDISFQISAPANEVKDSKSFVIPFALVQKGQQIRIEKKENPEPKNLEIKMYREDCSLSYIVPGDLEGIYTSQGKMFRVDFPQGAAFSYQGILSGRDETRSGDPSGIDHLYTDHKGDIYVKIDGDDYYTRIEKGKPYHIDILGREEGYTASFEMDARYGIEQKSFERHLKEIKEDENFGGLYVHPETGDFYINYSGRDYYDPGNSENVSLQEFKKIDEEDIVSVRISKRGYVQAEFKSKEIDKKQSGKFSIESQKDKNYVVLKSQFLDFQRPQNMPPMWEVEENEFVDATEEEEQNFRMQYENNPEWTLRESGEGVFWKRTTSHIHAFINYNNHQKNFPEFEQVSLEINEFNEWEGGKNTQNIKRGQNEVSFLIPVRPSTYRWELNKKKREVKEEDPESSLEKVYPNPVSPGGRLRLSFKGGFVPSDIDIENIKLGGYGIEENHSFTSNPLKLIRSLEGVVELEVPSDLERGDYVLIFGGKDNLQGRNIMVR